MSAPDYGQQSPPPPTYVPGNTPPPGYGPPPGPPGPPVPPDPAGPPGHHGKPGRKLHPLAIVGIVVGGLLVLCCAGGAVVAVLNPDAAEDGFNEGLGVESSETVDAVASPTGTATASPSAEPEPEPSPEPEPEPSPTAPARLTIPGDLVGMNAAIAEDQLVSMGFENIEFGSADQDETVVILPQNWTVVGVEPEPGSKIRPDALLILSCSKQ